MDDSIMRWHVPECFHIVQVAGLRLLVDDATRRDIEESQQAVRNDATAALTEYIDIVTVIGESVRIMLRAIIAIHESTPELRDRDRSVNDLFNREDDLHG